VEEIRSGSLYVVSTPIGNLGDVSYRAIHILMNVTLIASEDTRKTSILLKRYDITTPQVAYHSYNQKEQTPKILSKLKKGDSVAIVSEAGTPGISDPAYALIVPCIAHKIPIIPVPGASAVLAALVVSGLPMNRFVFEGFLPLKKGRKTRLLEIAEETRTIVIYESPHRIKKTVPELRAYMGDRFCCLAREMTKLFEEVFHGSLAGLEQHLNQKVPRGEYVLVIAGKE
jgi:16S rRNA (cytidine1402-2'-O)-methyltransferase